MNRLGNFEVQGRLGEGGMGVVYRALDLRDGDVVALKLLHPHHQFDEERRARFLREGQYAQLVKHPGVVAVREVGEVHLERGDRTLFLCLELVLGQDLLLLVSKETPRQRWVVEVGAALAEALAAIDAAGLVHRDVKPGNLLVTSDGGVKLLDLGLAMRRSDPESDSREGVPLGSEEANGGHDVMLTQYGSVVGTPGYAAPEQLRGETVDARADLYALGATLFQMLSGALPFAGDSPREILDAIEKSEKVAESKGQAASSELVLRLRKAAPGVSIRLAHLVGALMNPEPGSRPKSAALVAQALRELLDSDHELDRSLDFDPASEGEGAVAGSSAWMRLKDWWNS